MSIINRVIGIIITLILLCQWLLGYQLPAAMAFFLVAWLIGLVTMWLLPDTTTTANRQSCQRDTKSTHSKTRHKTITTCSCDVFLLTSLLPRKRLDWFYTPASPTIQICFCRLPSLRTCASYCDGTNNHTSHNHSGLKPPPCLHSHIDTHKNTQA